MGTSHRGGALISEFFLTMTVLKAGIAIFMVIVLSVIAEVVSPRFAGMVSGFPLGAAINLFFIGIEVGPEFASESALYTAVGLIATQVFAYAYFRASEKTKDLSRLPAILIASLAGVCGYFSAASLLRLLPVGAELAVGLPAASILVFDALLKGPKDVRIENRVALRPRELLLRSGFAAGTILLVTSTAAMVGARWAGLFSAFPITMLPFVAIIHRTYGAAYAQAVLRSVPRGLSSLLVYSLAVWASYRTHGAYVGTGIAYGFATLWLLGMQLKTIHSTQGAGRMDEDRS